MKRLPLLPTLIVALAVPVMIGLGIWQLERAEWKGALLARLEANARAPLIDRPARLEDALGFRRVRTRCREVEPREPTAARAVSGQAGYRQVIWCRDGRGEPLLVSVGVAPAPTIRVSVEPGTAFVGPLVPRSDRSPGDPRFLLVAEAPVPPLRAEAPPTPDTIPNNHLAYAAQWFFFAATLSAIYGVYLRRWFRASA